MKRFFTIAVLSILFFSAVPIAKAETEGAGEVTMMAVGDILPHPSWQPFQIPTFKLFEGVAVSLFEADVVIGNLESPLTGRAETASVKTEQSVDDKEDFVFKAEGEDTAEGLRAAGFTVLTLANNHMLDYREDGLLDTLDRLFRADVGCTGAGKDLESAVRPCEVEAGGAEFVVLAASDVVPKGFQAGRDKPGIASMKKDNEFIRRVEDARRFYPGAVLVLSLHWGTEAAYQPTNRQKALARRLIDAGADVIIGHHPHRIQGVEIYNGRPIFYSLGNFQFDTKPPGDETFIARLNYRPGSRVPSSMSVIPVKIAPGGYPNVLEPGTEDYNTLMGRLDKLCTPFGVKLDGTALVPVPPSDEKGYDYFGT